MTAVGEIHPNLATKCLDFCQALISQGVAFNFSLSIGSTFSFSLDTRGKASLSPGTKKKSSPSTLRRNARRRKEFLEKKQNPAPVIPTEEAVGETEPEKENIFQCDQCENNFKSENGLKIHIGKTHKKVDSILATPERPRQHSRSSVSLSASPLLDTSREESSTTSPEPAEQCRKCFSKPPFCICTEHFCKECCLEANHLFRVHSYR